MSEPDLISQKTLSTTQDDAMVMDDISSGDENSIVDKRSYGKYIREPDLVSDQIAPCRTYVSPQDMQKWFGDLEHKQDGKMTAKELQQAFEIFQGRYFSDSACKFVVRLFDLDQNGGLDIREFELLYYYIKQWVTAFNAYDKERTGLLDEGQLDFALKHMDIHFSPEFIRYLIQRTNPNATKMPLDKYIVTCIQIQRYTDEFKQRDTEFTGHINVKYEDFLEMVMRCSVI
ncbi:peflin-like [Coccinella septempunctata]|uniref:peflin-like n=1 Tax=Coccinella septempunctata TaxID=41139 RepID=UPI001D066FAC|nr:peflin-like [Coccinella septempunctata]